MHVNSEVQVTLSCLAINWLCSVREVMVTRALKWMSAIFITFQKWMSSVLTAFQNVAEKATVFISVLNAT